MASQQRALASQHSHVAHTIRKSNPSGTTLSSGFQKFNFKLNYFKRLGYLFHARTCYNFINCILFKFWTQSHNDMVDKRPSLNSLTCKIYLFNSFHSKTLGRIRSYWVGLCLFACFCVGFLFVLLFVFCFVETGFCVYPWLVLELTLFRWDWPRTLRNLPASVFWELGLKAHAITTQPSMSLNGQSLVTRITA